MRDACGRTIDYLRISVTDRCNLRCRFCMPESGVPSLPHAEILRFEEILQIVDAAADLGMTRYRVSGGEPLLRKGLPAFLTDLCSRPATTKVSLTTNGLLLAAQAEQLAAAGVETINVSLDTVSAERMTRLCGGGTPDLVLAGVDAALAAGLSVKLNTVLLRPVLDELPALLATAESRDVPIRFIEFMPLDPEAATRTGEEALTADELQTALARVGQLSTHPGPGGCGPSTYLAIEGRSVTVGLICAVSHPFCASCNRIRLTSDGRLKPCLASAHEIDVKSALRSGASREDLQRLLAETVAAKPAAHGMADGEMPQRAMCRIGG